MRGSLDRTMGPAGNRSEAGQASVEHIGLVALLALVFAAVVAATPAGASLAGVAETIAAVMPGSFGSDRQPDGSPRPAGAPLEPEEIVDRYLDADLEDFLAYRASPDRDPRLDYSSDLCTAPVVGSTGDSFDFTDACVRHDFGYRNYDRLGLFDERKDAVDARFLADMRDHCETRPESEDGRCRAWARIYYEAVQRFSALAGY